MSDRLKRVVIALLFLLLVAVIGFGVYYVFFKTLPPATTTPTSPNQPSATGTLPQAGISEGQTGASAQPPENGLPNAQPIEGNGAESVQPTTVILKESVVQQLSPSSDGNNVRYYDPINGKFYKMTPDGLSKPLSDKTYPNVDSVSWANTSDQAILTYPDGSNIHVDFQTDSQETLPKHWEDFTFSTNDRQIVAKTITTSPESRYLVIADPNGKNARAIEPLGENASQTFSAWTANDQIIAYATVGDALGLDRQQIILVGKNHENYKSLLVEGRGFEPLWSPTGNWIIYSVWTTANGYKPQLWVSGGSPGNLNDNRHDLNIQTWANKCAWHTDTLLYCGVPQSVADGAGLQQDTYEYSVQDHIVKIDLEAGTVTNLGTPDGAFSVKQPVVTADGEQFIFTDASTGYLYAYRLP
jgi:hypothetical protein